MGRTRTVGRKFPAVKNFNSLAPCGANHLIEFNSYIDSIFQLTRPAWGEPSYASIKGKYCTISTHSPRVGRTEEFAAFNGAFLNFNSLAPRGANLQAWAQQDVQQKFQLTRPAWGEPFVHVSARFYICISTHSPRVGRTQAISPFRYIPQHFNSLAPRGANLPFLLYSIIFLTFQLTRPAWGEPSFFGSASRVGKISTHSPRVGRTRPHFFAVVGLVNFNSLAPRGANPSPLRGLFRLALFQLTRPAWGEPFCPRCDASTNKFQLTRPAWGEPTSNLRNYPNRSISTHSPRVGRTPRHRLIQRFPQNFNSLAPRGANRHLLFFIASPPNFNSLAPRGANPIRTRKRYPVCVFQLTRPAWGEPSVHPLRYCLSRISTHSPRVGRTFGSGAQIYTKQYFNSLAPRGANPKWGHTNLTNWQFQLTRPAWGEPCRYRRQKMGQQISTHSPRVGRTLSACNRLRFTGNFNSLAPRGANQLAFR